MKCNFSVIDCWSTLSDVKLILWHAWCHCFGVARMRKFYHREVCYQKKNNGKLKNIVKQKRLSIPADIVMDIESLIQSWL